MINKNHFLASLGCTYGKLATEINELVFNWHRLYGLEIGSNEIDDKAEEGLRKGWDRRLV